MSHLRKQLEALRNKAERIQSSHQAIQAKAAAKNALRQRQQLDYTELIRDYMNTLPPTMRARRWRIEDFTHLYPARWRNGAKASQPIIGAALRQLGFTQCRDWTSAGRNTRYWVAPQQSKGER